MPVGICPSILIDIKSLRHLPDFVNNINCSISNISCNFVHILYISRENINFKRDFVQISMDTVQTFH